MTPEKAPGIYNSSASISKRRRRRKRSKTCPVGAFYKTGSLDVFLFKKKGIGFLYTTKVRRVASIKYALFWINELRVHARIFYQKLLETVLQPDGKDISIVRRWPRYLTAFLRSRNFKVERCRKFLPCLRNEEEERPIDRVKRKKAGKTGLENRAGGSGKIDFASRIISPCREGFLFIQIDRRFWGLMDQSSSFFFYFVGSSRFSRKESKFLFYFKMKPKVDDSKWSSRALLEIKIHESLQRQVLPLPAPPLPSPFRWIIIDTREEELRGLRRWLNP